MHPTRPIPHIRLRVASTHTSVWPKLYRFNRFSSLLLSSRFLIPRGPSSVFFTKKQENGGTHKTRMHQQTRLVLTWITPRVWTQLPACLSHSSYPHACEPNTCGSAALRLSGLRGVGSLAKSTNHLHSLVEMKRDHRED